MGVVNRHLSQARELEAFLGGLEKCRRALVSLGEELDRLREAQTQADAALSADVRRLAERIAVVERELFSRRWRDRRRVLREQRRA